MTVQSFNPQPKAQAWAAAEVCFIDRCTLPVRFDECVPADNACAYGAWHAEWSAQCVKRLLRLRVKRGG